MGKKDNLKAKEKKAERKAMEATINRGVVNVKAANDVEDPLALLPKLFSVFNKNGLHLKLIPGKEGSSGRASSHHPTAATAARQG